MTHTASTVSDTSDVFISACPCSIGCMYAGGKAVADFLAFHAANPSVYEVLRSLAWDRRGAGYQRCSITLLFNVARWELGMRVEHSDGMYLLNDHHQAFYARALMHFEPGLTGLFSLRRAPEADAWADHLRGASTAAAA